MPEVLYKYVVGVKCRVIPALPGKCHMENQSWQRVQGSTGEELFITQELDEIQLKEDLKELRDLGIESLAVVLTHSYTLVNHSNKDLFATVNIFQEIFSKSRSQYHNLYNKILIIRLFRYILLLCCYNVVMRLMKSESAN